MEVLRSYFNANCYPRFLFDKFLKKFLKDKFQPIIPTTTVPKLTLYASMPYSNDSKFLITLSQIVRKYFYCVNPKLILKNPKTIGSYLKFKDTVPKLMRSMVVYKYTCPKCNFGTYLGSTKRMLRVRIDAHAGVSHRTGCNLKSKEYSSIRDHANKCNSPISYDHFEIIGQAADETSLLILESLCIKQLVPSLNNQSSSAPLYVS